MNPPSSDLTHALIDACTTGDVAQVQILVHCQGVRLTVRDPGRQVTPLHMACAEGHLTIVEWILAWTHLMNAYREDPPDYEDVYYIHNSHSGDSQDQHPSATPTPPPPTPTTIDYQDADEDADYYSSSAASSPMHTNDPLLSPSVTYLLQAVDSVGNTPLHYACANGHTTIVRALARAMISKEAIDQPDMGGWRHLWNTRNGHGRTPLEWAEATRKTGVVAELQRWKPPPEPPI